MNTTYFLDPNFRSPDTNKVVTVQQVIDFSKQNVASAGTFDAIKIPAGAFVLYLFARVDTADTHTTSAIALAPVTNSGGPAASIVLSAANVSVISDADAYTTSSYFAANDTIRGTVSVADAIDGILTVGAVYFVPAPASSI